MGNILDICIQRTDKKPKVNPKVQGILSGAVTAANYNYWETYHLFEQRRSRDRELLKEIIQILGLDAKHSIVEIKEYCKFLALLIGEKLRSQAEGCPMRRLIPPPKVFQIWRLDYYLTGMTEYPSIAHVGRLVSAKDLEPNSLYNSCSVDAVTDEARLSDFLCYYVVSKHQRKVHFGAKNLEFWPEPFEALIESLFAFYVSKKKLPPFRAYLKAVSADMDLTPLRSDNTWLLQTCTNLIDRVRQCYGLESLTDLYSPRDVNPNESPAAMEEMVAERTVLKLRETYFKRFKLVLAHSLIISPEEANIAIHEFIRFSLLLKKAGQTQHLIPPPMVFTVWRMFHADNVEYEAFLRDAGLAQKTCPPSQGLLSFEGMPTLLSVYRTTIERYIETYGERPPEFIWPSELRPNSFQPQVLIDIYEELAIERRAFSRSRVTTSTDDKDSDTLSCLFGRDNVDMRDASMNIAKGDVF
eukprot:TRINITY_DN3942_c0_g1_i5.p1 TRINITY_DN3942_c0_g1~~TRINITY_DN3942_c0_g1_i5.p1  ORF type:complete len:469 (-),score=87.12 TRINITY_DN3942_c0_g1_i5:71-1477(-)